jgi:hypothetical protein
MAGATSPLAAKPPDLPLNFKFIVTPWLSIEDDTNPAPQESNTPPGPPAGPVYQAVPAMRPIFQLTPSVRRNLAECLLLGIHPLMGLVPTDELLDAPCDHPKPVTPVVPSFEPVLTGIQETRTGSLVIGVGVNSDAGLTGSIVLNERNFQLELPKMPCDSTSKTDGADPLWTKKWFGIRVESEGMGGGVESLNVVEDVQAEAREQACWNLLVLRLPEETPPAPPETPPSLFEMVEVGKTCFGYEAFGIWDFEGKAVCNHEPIKLVVRFFPIFAPETLGQPTPCSAKLMPDRFLEGLSLPGVATPTDLVDGPMSVVEPVREVPKEKEIEWRLSLPVNLNYKDVPLKQIIGDFRDSQGINIIFDNDALDEKGIRTDQPVSVELEQISLKSALRLVLKQFHLTYVIKNEVLQITTEKEEPKEDCFLSPPGVDVQVRGLMKACRLAAESGRLEQAADLAREACALDPVQALSDSVLCRMYLLAKAREKGKVASCPAVTVPESCPVMCQPTWTSPPSSTQPSEAKLVGVAKKTEQPLFVVVIEGGTVAEEQEPHPVFKSEAKPYRMAPLSCYRAGPCQGKGIASSEAKPAPAKLTLDDILDGLGQLNVEDGRFGVGVGPGGLRLQVQFRVKGCTFDVDCGADGFAARVLSDDVDE